MKLNVIITFRSSNIILNVRKLNVVQFSLSDGDTEGFRRILDVNVMGVALCTREAIRSMKARQVDGHIFNINRFDSNTIE